MTYCGECGVDHHAGERKDSMGDEVKIAKIRADAEVEIARIQRGEAKAVVQAETETEIAVTEIAAAAAVEIAAETGPPETETEPETTAIVVEGPPAEIPEESEPTMSPADESSIPELAAPRKSRGYWP